MVKVKKNGKKAWVTFTFAPTDEVRSVSVMGEWSDWKEEPLKRKKSGDFSITKVLKVDENFEFGYKIDGDSWVIEDQCPSVDSPYFSKNSLLEL
ncbi:MAG: hypothetical protein U9N33_03485 [Campylobacterota bacterium]|nr:hypothetical protein [Campylobacterota bacterium]